MLMGFSIIINQPFLDTPIYGNPQVMFGSQTPEDDPGIVLCASSFARDVFPRLHGRQKTRPFKELIS